MKGRLSPVFCALILTIYCGKSARSLTGLQAPTELSFPELIRLAGHDAPTADAAEHLQQLLSQPFISNEATLSGVRPVRPVSPGLGPVLRVAEWNIERGINEPEVEMALSKSSRFEDTLRGKAQGSSDTLHRIRQERQVLQDADIVILNEADLGMKRTQYRDVTRTLAQALHFNYVYGVEFIELNRLYLGLKKMDGAAPPFEHDPAEAFGVNPKLYRGLEGSAILTRYPIRTARIVRLPECYDWFHGEIQQVSDLERVKRWSAEKLFEERVRRQVRRGGRIALIVDLAVPEAPGQQVTVVSPHLENYCPPECRRQQMAYLLEQIKNITNPVILGGDFNTTGHDQTPTSIRHEILKRVLNYRFWIRKAIFWFVPVPFVGLIDYPINYFKNYHDPTALNMRFVAPNREKPLFNDARRFRFVDGGAFDFGGQNSKTFGDKSRTLAQSNQRSWKGFVPTFSFKRNYFHLVGSYKLDWFLVKPAVAVRDLPEMQPPFTPYQGRTLKDVNTALDYRISDHCPIVVDLPLATSAVVSIASRP